MARRLGCWFFFLFLSPLQYIKRHRGNGYLARARISGYLFLKDHIVVALPPIHNA